MSRLRPGHRLASRYDIIEPIGEGGMGAVYAAHDSVLSRTVALKVLHGWVTERPDARKRFVREAKVAASLKHPNAIRIFDFGEDRGQPYLAMERLVGCSLADKIAREGRLGVGIVIHIVSAVAGVLAAAHAASLIHRDIKPDNIFIEDATGRVVVLDFGMAFLGEAEDPETGRLTTDGLSGGTPAYMAPEQCSGLDPTGATDVYALGCVLFESLTGEPPFTAASPTKYFIRHLYDAPPSLLQVRKDAPRAIDELVARMLAKRPNDRPTSAIVEKRLALISEVTPENRERARDASYLAGRAARALPRPTPAIPMLAGRAPLRVLVIANHEDNELRLGLAAVGIHADFGDFGSFDGHDAIYVIGVDLERLAYMVAEASVPVLVGLSDSGIDKIKALLRLGISDVVTRPRSAAQLSSKLRRHTKRN